MGCRRGQKREHPTLKARALMAFQSSRRSQCRILILASLARAAGLLVPLESWNGSKTQGALTRRTMMRFYNGQHRYYCGVDLHTKRMYLCILDQEGNTRLHRNVRAKPYDFLSAIAGFRDDLVVGAECMFTWYWLADLCR